MRLQKLLAIAKKWPNCMIVADEIYDGLDFSGRHVSVASLSDDVPVSLLTVYQKCTTHLAGELVTWQYMTLRKYC